MSYLTDEHISFQYYVSIARYLSRLKQKKKLETPFWMCYIDNRKGKAREAAYPKMNQDKLFTVWPSTIGSSWRLFSSIPENLVNKTDKGNNEY